MQCGLFEYLQKLIQVLNSVPIELSKLVMKECLAVCTVVFSIVLYVCPELLHEMDGFVTEINQVTK